MVVMEHATKLLKVKLAITNQVKAPCLPAQDESKGLVCATEREDPHLALTLM